MRVLQKHIERTSLHSVSKNNSIFINNAMEQTAADAYQYSLISVLVFGILGNILVIISIARQKQLLKKNYYFLVLHLAVCDLVASFFRLLSLILYFFNVTRYSGFNIACLFHLLHYSFYLSGLAMMLMISMLRYRATVHPLKPTVSRGKLINFCCIGYVTSLTTGLGLNVPSCMNVKLNHSIYTKFISGLDLFLYLVPTVFMIVCYCKIGLALVKQNKQIKRMGSAAVRNRHNHDRRIFLVCLCTVVCFAFGRLLFSVTLIWIIAGEYSLFFKYFWVYYISYILVAAGTVSANPVIYGILDKRMFRFLTKKKRIGHAGNLKNDS